MSFRQGIQLTCILFVELDMHLSQQYHFENCKSYYNAHVCQSHTTMLKDISFLISSRLRLTRNHLSHKFLLEVDANMTLTRN